jgi:hypothetical protein
MNRPIEKLMENRKRSKSTSLNRTIVALKAYEAVAKGDERMSLKDVV